MLSPTARQQLIPHIKPAVLPYVAINGQRRVSREIFDSAFLPAMAESSAISSSIGDATLTIAINDAEEDKISISYTYSRPARSGSSSDSDPLYKPDRSLDDAKVIPEEFYEELQAFSSSSSPFSTIADPRKAREDKLLSWLMRSVKIPKEDVLSSLPARIGLLGDAVHAMPIVAGEGGNHAILDGLALGECLGTDMENGYRTFLEKEGERWERGVEQSEENVSNLHGHTSRL
jgi:hypothetical protein